MATQDKTINDTSAAILGLLHQEPMNGNQILGMAGKWITPYFSITRSQVYRELVAMEKVDLVREGDVGPRGSRSYRITPAGKKTFQAWAKQGGAVDSIRNTTALRLAFVGLIGKKTIATMIETLKMEHKAHADLILERLKEAAEADLIDDLDALRFALMYHKIAITWLGAIKL